MAARTEEPDGAPPRRRWPRVLAFVLTFLVVLGVAAYVAFPYVARAMVVRELAARGLRLERGTIDVSMSTVTLRDVKLVSNEGVSIEMVLVEVDHDLVTARAVRVSRLVARGGRAAMETLDARLRGTPTTVENGEIVLDAIGFGLPDDAAVTVRFGRATREDTSFDLDDLKASIALPSMGETLAIEAPTAELSSGGVKEGEELAFYAPRETRDAKDPGPIVTLSAEGRGTIPVRGFRYLSAPESLTFTLVDLEELRVAIKPQKRALELSTDRLPKERLGRFGVEPPGDVSGKVSVTIDDLAKRSAKASFDVKLQGFVPPHPRELNGIVFGEHTVLRGDAEVHLDGTTPRGTLSNLVLEAGVLSMKGEGSFDGKGIEVTMQGSVACSELATSALSAHLGFAIGMGTSPLSRRFLGGTVGVTVKVEAAYATLASPTISPNAVVRCSLKLGL